MIFIVVSALQTWGLNEPSAIKQTAIDYMESWYHGDAKKMKRSLHKKLAKRALNYGYGSKSELRLTKASQMVSYTKNGYGKDLWNDNSTIEVITSQP